MILNIYKPKNWTSFDVVAKVRKLSGIKKVGHAGTLDPLAEGVLIVLTDSDTKLQDTFKDLQKQYYFEFVLGVKTPSYDLETLPEFVEEIHIPDVETTLKEIIPNFMGEQLQTVPIYSAKKVNGKRLYDVARKSSIETLPEALPTNKITISDIELVDISSTPVDTDKGMKTVPFVRCNVSCSSGTYVRSLAVDIAKKLNSTAVVTKILRTAIGDYTVKTCMNIEDLKF